MAMLTSNSKCTDAFSNFFLKNVLKDLFIYVSECFACVFVRASLMYVHVWYPGDQKRMPGPLEWELYRWL